MTTVASTTNMPPPEKKKWQWPGLIGLIRFIFTGHWPTPKEDDDTDHSRFADKLGRALALPMFVFFSVGAVLSVVKDPIEANVQAFQTGRPVDFVGSVAVAITLGIFGYGDLTMVSAAGSLRDKIANRKPWRERVLPLFFVVVIATLEAVAFGGLIYLLEKPTTLASWISLVGRSGMGPMCVIWFAVTPKRIPTQDEMDQRFIYRLSMAREALLKTINLKAIDSLLYFPVIEQLRMWLAGEWTTEAEKKLQDFMDMIKKLDPSTGGMPSLETTSALEALLGVQAEIEKRMQSTSSEQVAITAANNALSEQVQNLLARIETIPDVGQDLDDVAKHIRAEIWETINGWMSDIRTELQNSLPIAQPAYSVAANGGGEEGGTLVPSPTYNGTGKSRRSPNQANEVASVTTATAKPLPAVGTPEFDKVVEKTRLQLTSLGKPNPSADQIAQELGIASNVQAVREAMLRNIGTAPAAGRARKRQ